MLSFILTYSPNECQSKSFEKMNTLLLATFFFFFHPDEVILFKYRDPIRMKQDVKVKV